jgi:hypothetical protein
MTRRRSAAANGSKASPLKLAIVECGDPQWSIADAVQMSRFRLSRIVRERQVPTPDEQDRLAEFLKRSRRTLFHLVHRDD